MFNNRNCLKCIKNVDLVFENGWLLVRAITMHLIVSDKIIGKCILLECQINVHYSINFFALHIENVQVKMEIMRKKNEIFCDYLFFFYPFTAFFMSTFNFRPFKIVINYIKTNIKIILQHGSISEPNKRNVKWS